MQHNEVITKNDAEMARALRSVLSQAQFPIKGEAILKVASLIQWINTLDKKIENTCAEVSKPKRKDLNG